jgi:hypothetical protein
MCASFSVISVGTKKKELVGEYRNGGSDYRPKSDPSRVKAPDFVEKQKGEVAPYGVYDVTANAVSSALGSPAKTAEFVVQPIRC